MWMRAYILLRLLLMPWTLLRLYVKGIRDRGYRREIAARFGRWDQAPDGGGVWVHAPDVSETVAAVPLLRAMEALAPSTPRVVTVETAAARGRAADLLGESADPAWLPWDLPWAVRGFLRRVQPRLLVLVEARLRPVLLRECRRAGVRVVLVNARFPASAGRVRRIAGGLLRPLLEQLELIACQDVASAERFRAAGAPADRVIAPGNMKFDTLLPGDLSVRMDLARDRLGADDGPLLVAGSTHEGEEALLLDAFVPLLRRHPDWRLLIVPRHASRFAAVWRLLDRAPLASARLSSDEVAPGTRLLLGDLMGELVALYGLADAVILGGSLVEEGGHNPLEPAWHAVPTFAGPHLENFADVAEPLVASGALEVLPDASALAQAVERVLESDELWQQRSDAARTVVDGHRGALGQILAAIRPL